MIILEKGNYVKLILSLLIANAIRLLKIIPNNDPIMGMMLPYSRQERWWVSPLFAFITMASFDVLTNKIGIWTLVTSFTYAAIALVFQFAYRRMRPTMGSYLVSGAFGVLVFDFVTGPVMSSYMFGMSFAEAFFGQVPFTALHLLSVSFFVLFLTPILDKSLIDNIALEDTVVMKKIAAIART